MLLKLTVSVALFLNLSTISYVTNIVLWIVVKSMVSATVVVGTVVKPMDMPT